MLDLIFPKGAGKRLSHAPGQGIVSGYWKAAGMYSVDSVEFRILQAIIVFFWGIKHIENQEDRGL